MTHVTFNLSMGLGHGLAPGKTHFIQGDPANSCYIYFDVLGLNSDILFNCDINPILLAGDESRWRWIY